MKNLIKVLFVALLGLATICLSSCNKEEEEAIEASELKAIEAAELAQKDFDENTIGFPGKYLEVLGILLSEHKNPYGFWKSHSLQKDQEIDHLNKGKAFSGMLQKRIIALANPEDYFHLRYGPLHGTPKSVLLYSFEVQDFKTVYAEPAELRLHLERIQLTVVDQSNPNFQTEACSWDLKGHFDPCYGEATKLVLLPPYPKYEVNVFNADTTLFKITYWHANGSQWGKFR